MAHEITITSYISVFSYEMTGTLPFKNHRNQKTECFFIHVFLLNLEHLRKLIWRSLPAPWFKITAKLGNHQIFRNSGQGTLFGKIGRNGRNPPLQLGKGFSGENCRMFATFFFVHLMCNVCSLWFISAPWSRDISLQFF